jgi:NAD(P) transhydrogenase subunit alpha
MRIGVPKERWSGERRVALVPESVKKLVGAGIPVLLETGAGASASFPDGAYQQAGAQIETDPAQIYARAELLLKVRPPLHRPDQDEISWMRPGQMLLTSLMAARNLQLVKALAERKVTVFSTDAIPRTTRAQPMDTLSSMASISGYKGVLLAALELPKYFPMLMTAAGTVLAAKVFVIGAGVAGLQAIATARRLGARVFATDVRPEVKDQIESVGGKYVGIELKESAAAGGGYAKELSDEDRKRQRELLVEQCAQSDVVITTALIGGVHAPKLIGFDVLTRMKPGSVLVDLAADGGGNCELSKPGETVVVGGVTILAPLELASTMPQDASLLWSRNLTHFVLAFYREGGLQIDLGDEIMKGALLIHEGTVREAKIRDALSVRGAA